MTIRQVGTTTDVDGGGSVATITLTRTCAAKSFLVLCIQTGGDLSADPTGWTYVNKILNVDSALYETYVYTLANVSSGSLSVTVNRLAAGTLRGTLMEFSGMGTTPTLDKTTVFGGNATGAASVFPSTGWLSAAVTLAIASFYNAAASGDTLIGPAGWNVANKSSAPIEFLIAWLVTKSNTALAPYWTVSVNAENANVLANFIPSADAGPAITSPPQNVGVAGGGFATFTVGATASAGTLHYQWSVNGVNVGSDSATLVYQPATKETLSQVSVSVTDDNGDTIASCQLRVYKPRAKPARKRQLFNGTDNVGVNWFANSLFLPGEFDPSRLNLPVSTTGIVKQWNGSAWVNKPQKEWNGSAWVAKTTKRWNGTSWIACT